MLWARAKFANVTLASIAELIEWDYARFDVRHFKLLADLPLNGDNACLVQFDNTLVVICRGTYSRMGWIMNALFWPEHNEGEVATWHGGMLTAARTVFYWIKSMPQMPHLIVGHSRGAGIAQIVSSSFPNMFGVGFASPKVLRSGEPKYPTNMTNFVAATDFVTKVPPFLGWSHVGAVIPIEIPNRWFAIEHYMADYKKAIWRSYT